MSATNNLIFDVCEQIRRKQQFNIHPIRDELNESPYSKGYTKNQLDMRRKAEILKYSSNTQSNQTNNLTQREKYALLLKGKLNNKNANTVNTTASTCPIKHSLSSSSGIPGPIIDMYYDESVPLYNYINEKYTRPYGINPQDVTEPWTINDLLNVIHNTSDGLTEIYGNYNTIATVCFRYILNQSYQTFYLLTPLSIRINAKTKRNVNITHNISISNLVLSVFYNNTIVSSSDPNVPNIYNLPRPEIDASSLKSIIMDVSANGNEVIELEKYIGILKVTNLVMYSAIGYIYDIKLSFQVKIESQSLTTEITNNYNYFNINILTNISSDISITNNCSLNQSSPNPGPFYNFYLSPFLFLIEDVFNITLGNPNPTTIDVSFEKYNPHHVNIVAINGTTQVISNTYYRPIITPITFVGLLPDISYSFIVTPYNDTGVSGNPKTSSNAIYTMSYISNLVTSTNDTSSVFIDFSNSDLSYIMIKANSIIGSSTFFSSTTYNKNISRPIIYNELTSGVRYTFTVILYNNANVAGIPLTSSNITYTLSSVGNVVLKTFDASSIQIDLSNSDLSYVLIQANSGITNNKYSDRKYSSPLQKPLLYTGLNPNSQYNFTVTPFNNTLLPGTPIQPIINSIYTYSYVSNVKVGVFDSSAILIDFSYSDLSFVKIYANTVDKTNNISANQVYNYPLQTPILYNGLLSGVNYRFTLVPYNRLENPGLPVNSNTVYTLSRVSNITTKGYDSSAILIDFSSSDLSYVIIQANIENTNVVDVSHIYYNINNFVFNGNILFDGLQLNNGYSITIIPYNNANVRGLPVKSERFAYTVSTVNNVYLSAYDSSSIRVDFSNSDLSYVIIQANIGNTNISTGITQTFYPPFTTAPIFNGLQSDVSYSFMVTPYSKGNDIGISVASTTAVYTLSTVNNVYLSAYDSSSIRVDFSNSDLSYVKIQANIGNTNISTGFPQYFYPPFTTAPIFNGLQSDVSYTFVVIPFNKGIQGGVPVANTIALYTLSRLTNITVSNTNAYSVEISFNLFDPSFIRIQSIKGSQTWNTIDYPSPIQIPIRHIGLEPNTSYSFNVTPFNRDNQMGIVNTTSTYLTNYDVSSIELNNTYAYEIDISFNYTLDVSYVNVKRTQNNNIVNTPYYTPITMPIKQKDLLTDTLYSWMITPFNTNDISYNNYSLSNNNTVSDITNIIIEDVLTNKANIRFNYAQDVSYVNISIKSNEIVITQRDVYIKINGISITMPIQFDNLIEGTTYQFVLSPYSYTPQIGNVKITSDFTTLSIVNNIIVSNPTSTTIDISFNRSLLQKVAIMANLAGTNTNIKTTNVEALNMTNQITITDLSADVQYDFTIIPYNINLLPGPIIKSPAIYTTSTVNNITLFNIKATSIDISFNKSDLSYVIIQANIGRTSTNIGNIIVSSPSGNITYSNGLLPDVSYSFTVIPYNHDTPSFPGLAVTSTYAKYTLSIVSNVKTSVNDSSSIRVDFSNSDLSYVSIQANIGNTNEPTGLPKKFYPPFTTAPIFNGLTQGVSYSFVVTPYNHENVAGTSVGNTTAVYTLSTVSNVMTSEYDSSAIRIRFENSDISYVIIQANIRSTTSVFGSNIYYPPFTDGIIFKGLQTNVSYSFRVTPYNGEGRQGIPQANATAVYTLSTVSNVITMDYDSTNIKIDFSYSDISYVIMRSFKGSGIDFFTSRTKYYPFATNILFDGLMKDASYNFSVTPYNSGNRPGIIAYSNTSIYTLSDVSNVTSIAIDNSAIRVDFINSDLSYVSIQANLVTTGTSVGIKQFYPPFTTFPIFTELQSGKGYHFNVIPYNHVNRQGFQVSTQQAVYTLSTVNNVVSNTFDSSSVQVSFTYSDISYVIIKANKGNTTNDVYDSKTFYSPFTTAPIINGLLEDTSYNFSVTPYNNDSKPGITVTDNTDSIYTLSRISNVTRNAFDSSSIRFTFDYSDLSYINFQANGGNETTYMNYYLINRTIFFPVSNVSSGLSNFSYYQISTNNNNIPSTYANSLVNILPGSNTNIILYSYNLQNIPGTNIKIFNSTGFDLSVNTVIKSSPYLYYKFNIVDDYKNYATINGVIDGVSVNSASIEASVGKYENSLLITENKYFQLSSNLLPLNINGYTISLWVLIKGTVTDHEDSKLLFIFRDSTSNNYIKMDCSWNSTINKYKLYIDSSGNSGRSRIDSSGIIQIDTWTHVSWTLEKNNNSNVYVNGQRTNTGTINNVKYYSYPYGNCYLGNQPEVFYSKSMNIDEFYYFDAILDSNQIIDICNNTYTWFSGNGGFSNDSTTDMNTFVLNNNKMIKLASIGNNWVISQLPTYTNPIYNGLQPDISYSFTVTPYNHVNVAGAPVIDTAPVYTLSTVSNVITSVNDSSSIRIDFSNSRISNVIIQANIGSTNNPSIYIKKFENLNPTSNSLLFNEFPPNKSYSFMVTPYNHDNVAGVPVANTTAVYTLSYFNKASITGYNDTTVQINLFSEYSDLSYIEIIANEFLINEISYIKSIITISKPLPTFILYGELTYGKKYNFTIIPYNDANIPGRPLITSNITL